MNNKVTIQLISASPDFKILDISGQAGDALKQHKVNINAVLLVRQGEIVYTENGTPKKLAAGECVGIPANVFHEVTCSSEAKFFVVMPVQAKMKFKTEA